MRIRTAIASSAALLALAACGGNRDAGATADSAGAAAGNAVAGAGAAMDSAAGRVGAGMTGDSGVMAPGTGAGTNASLADPSTAAQLDSVNTAAKSGLTALAPAVAVPLIRSIEDKLDNSNDPALTDIAKDLEKLREELDEGTVDGGDVGEILRRLGPKVTAAAGKGGAAAGTLRSIGAELTRAGGTLH